MSGRERSTRRKSVRHRLNGSRRLVPLESNIEIFANLDKRRLNLSNPDFCVFPRDLFAGFSFSFPTVEPLIKYSILTFFFSHDPSIITSGLPDDFHRVIYFLFHLFFASLRGTDNRVLWHGGPIQIQNAIILIFSNSLSILLRKHWDNRWIFDHEIISRKFITHARKSFILDSNFLWTLN